MRSHARSRRPVSTPIGTVLLIGDQGHLHELRLPPAIDHHEVETRVTRASARPPAESDEKTSVDAAWFAAARDQLDAYFAGELRAFDLPVALEGSAFFLAVWKAVRAIPFGQTRTYGEIAAQLGRPRAARAVGLANGRNPLPIVVPCHRLIGADGSLTGYGGGLARKRWLLEHEARLVTSG
jgi:methylated-DNA-[protein]-cysteine S-methyltransferase